MTGLMPDLQEKREKTRLLDAMLLTVPMEEIKR